MAAAVAVLQGMAMALTFLLEEILGHGQGPLGYEGLGFLSVRHMAGIGNINQVFMGKQVADGAEH